MEKARPSWPLERHPTDGAAAATRTCQHLGNCESVAFLTCATAPRSTGTSEVPPRAKPAAPRILNTRGVSSRFYMILKHTNHARILVRKTCVLLLEPLYFIHGPPVLSILGVRQEAQGQGRADGRRLLARAGEAEAPRGHGRDAGGRLSRAWQAQRPRMLNTGGPCMSNTAKV